MLRWDWTGSGFGEDVTHGPLINDRAIAKAKQHVDDAVSKGANILAGGKVMSSLGPRFFQPTVLVGAKKDMLVAQEETFGPLAAIFKFDTEQEVIDLANDPVNIKLADEMWNQGKLVSAVCHGPG